MLILGVALLTSKGAHGIPGSAIVVLAATLSAVPVIPAIGLVLVLSVDWFMGMARALGNLIGNCVATVVIAAWEGDIDRERAHAVLNGTHEDPTEDQLFDARRRDRLRVANAARRRPIPVARHLACDRATEADRSTTMPERGNSHRGNASTRTTRTSPIT